MAGKNGSETAPVATAPAEAAQSGGDEIAKLKALHAAEIKALEGRLANERKSSSERIASLEAQAEKQRTAYEQEIKALEGRLASLETMIGQAGMKLEQVDPTKLVFCVQTRLTVKGVEKRFQKGDDYPIGDIPVEETEGYKTRGIIGPKTVSVIKPIANIAMASPGMDPTWAQSQASGRPALPRHIG